MGRAALMGVGSRGTMWWCSSNNNNSNSRRRRRDEVYVAAVGLRATQGPAQLLMSAAYNLNFWDFHHFMVIIKPYNYSPHNQVLVYDFQPKDPENIWVAAAALSGREVSGVVLVRKLGQLPKRKCWFVGYTNDEDAIDAAHNFNKYWDTNLKIGRHDCRNYCEGLVECLIGERIMLEQLRGRIS